MSNLPKVTSWPDQFPLVEPTVQNPIRAASSGVGDEFVVKIAPVGTPGAVGEFLTRDGRWLPMQAGLNIQWGGITGTISDQADLWAELQARPKTTAFHSVAFSGNYNELLNKPVLGDLAFINKSGLTSQFLRGDGVWAIPVDVNATWGNISGSMAAQTDLTAALALKAPLASPTFTGTPAGPTPPLDDNSTRFATTAWYFGQAFNGVPQMDGVGSSGALTLWARGDHRHPTDTTRAPLDTPNFIGLPTAPTPTAGNDSQLIATTAFVKAAVTSGVAGAVPGANTQVIFNDGGAWGADSGLTFAKATDALALGGAVIVANKALLQTAATGAGQLQLVRPADGYGWRLTPNSANVLEFRSGSGGTDAVKGTWSDTGVFELRGDATPQILRIYNTYTDASNYERAQIAWSANELQIGPTFAGTGLQRNMRLTAATGTMMYTGASHIFGNAATTRWTIDTNGMFVPFLDNTYDIGTGSFRVRSLSLGTALYVPSIQATVSISTPILNSLTNNAVEVRNGTSPQGFSIYNTYTDASNYERLRLVWSTNYALINSEAAGTGVQRNMRISAPQIELGTGGLVRWTVDPNGQFIPNVDQVNDIGLPAGPKVRNIYALKVFGVSYEFNANTVLALDASGALAQRVVGGIAQSYRLYNTYTDASNFERLNVGWATNVAYVVTELAGTGVARALAVGTNSAEALYFRTNSTNRWYVNAGLGHFAPLADATYDIGGASARVNSIYAAATVKAGGPSSQFVVGRRDTGADAWALFAASTSLQFYDSVNARNRGIWNANGFEIYNATTAQSFFNYGTFTDVSNYERGAITWASSIMYVGTEAAGTGTLRALTLKSASLTVRVNGTDMWQVPASGAIYPLADNTYDIGGTNRVRMVYTNAVRGNTALSMDVSSYGGAAVAEALTIIRKDFGGGATSCEAVVRSFVGAANLTVDAKMDSTHSASLNFKKNSVQRWSWFCTNSAETGSNTGSNMVLARNDDAGAQIDTPITVARNTGIVTIKTSLASLALSKDDGTPDGTMKAVVDAILARLAALEAKVP